MATAWLLLCTIVFSGYGLDSLKASTFPYASEKLLGDAVAMSEKIGQLLIHGETVQVMESASKILHRPPKKKSWALYNPSLLQLSWRGELVFLLTYRAGTWQLCRWDGRSSPLASLPEVDGRNQATSKVMAAIVRKDFSTLVPVHELLDQKYTEHSCLHSTGMRRVGIDDSRLFSLADKPYALFAGVAPVGQDYPCQHRQYLCALQLPDDIGSSSKVRCQKKILLTFAFADELSERMLRQDRLGSVHQKNWMPFVANNELYLIFTIEPLRVMHVDVETGLCSHVSLVRTPALSALHPREDEFRGHGGPPLVQLGSELLGMARVQSGNLLYSHFFFTIRVAKEPSSSAPVTVSRVSRLLCFGSTTRGLCEVIQFVGGLHIDKEQLVITYGVNDCEPKVTTMALSDVASLTPAKGVSVRKSGVVKPGGANLNRNIFGRREVWRRPWSV
eukprot:symbB.v1.2.023395.t1/scaffold2138.1/size88104/7